MSHRHGCMFLYNFQKYNCTNDNNIFHDGSNHRYRRPFIWKAPEALYEENSGGTEIRNERGGNEVSPALQGRSAPEASEGVDAVDHTTSPGRCLRRDRVQ